MTDFNVNRAMYASRVKEPQKPARAEPTTQKDVNTDKCKAELLKEVKNGTYRQVAIAVKPFEAHIIANEIEDQYGVKIQVEQQKQRSANDPVVVVFTFTQHPKQKEIKEEKTQNKTFDKYLEMAAIKSTNGKVVKPTKLSKETQDILNAALHGRCKRGAKLTFDISNIDPSEIQIACAKIENAGFATYISSGNMVVQK